MEQVSTLEQSRAVARRSSRSLWIRLHKRFALLGGMAAVIWCVSGLLHPLMTTFGPQQAQFMPPRAALDLQDMQPVQETLRAAGIQTAAAVRIVAGADGQVLQVTTDPDQPRRYFDLRDGAERVGEDLRHAEFLARHYLGDTVAAASVVDTQFLTDFTADYPWVNRLLPVYRLTFDTPDKRVAFVYTETNALATVNNTFKNRVQTGFRWLHTWDWLPASLNLLRVVIILAMVGSLFLLAVSGLGMLIGIRRKQAAPGLRGWHRGAAYVFLVPLAMLSSSGLFHLLQSAWQEPERNLRFANSLQLDSLDFALHEQWDAMASQWPVESVSLVTARDGTLLYRLGLRRDANGVPSTPSEIRSARFAGLAPTGPAVYLDAATGAPWAPGDRELALQLGEHFSGVDRSAFSDVTLVTRFGSNYDFRNKRLPVWRIDVGAPVNATLFVDTTTGVLADRVDDAQKPERTSFSVLHKWNFLMMFGRSAQTPIVVIVVTGALIFMGVLGLLMLRRRPH